MDKNEVKRTFQVARLKFRIFTVVGKLWRVDVGVDEAGHQEFVLVLQPGDHPLFQGIPDTKLKTFSQWRNLNYLTQFVQRTIPA